MAVMYRPRIFIGSSEEGLPVAKTLEVALERDAEPRLWTRGVFSPGQGTLEALEAIKGEFDAAVIVLTPDDIVDSRDEKKMGPRDNAVFELGFFTGCLGRFRTFLLCNRNHPTKIPSDLSGIQPLTYGDRSDGKLEPALGPAATQLIDRCRDLGPLARLLVSTARDGPAAVSEKPSIYWAAPHGNEAKNDAIKESLELLGIAVSLPYDLVAKCARRKRSVPPAEIRTICMQAIRSSDLVVVDLETYGLDTAWEIGYADAIRIRVIGISQDGRGIAIKKVVNRRESHKNYMHGWDRNQVYDSLEAFARIAKGKRVHVCGSFRNEAAMVLLRRSQLRELASELILPKDVIDLKEAVPSGWRAREEAIRIQEEADIALVILPRYGMTSWQLGYAEGTNQPTFGWRTDDFGAEIEESLIWDYWMHGWKARLTLTSVKDLAAFLLGQRRVRVPQVPVTGQPP